MSDLRRAEARIFLIDDEPANLKLLDKLLSSQGYARLVLIQDPREVLPERGRIQVETLRRHVADHTEQVDRQPGRR